MDQLVLRGGAVCTVDAQNTFFPSGQIVVEGGVIRAVEPATAQGVEPVLDTTHCLVIPGLVNAHTHLFLSMWRGLDDQHTLFPWLEILGPAILKMTEEDYLYSNYLGCMESLLAGTTTVCECCRYQPRITAQVASTLGLRSLSGGMPASEWFGNPLPVDLALLESETRRLMEEQSKYGGLATAYIGAHSPYNCSPEFLQAVRALADQLGVPFNIHLAECLPEIEIIRERYGMTPVRFLSELGVLREGVIANHCVWFTDEDLEIFRQSGAGIVHCPISNAKLWSGVAPVKRYLDAGIPVALGTDSMVSNNSLDLFQEMKFGALLQRVTFQPTGATGALTAMDYLRMATIGGAKVLGMEQLIGSIEVGKRADLVVVELPPEMPVTRDHVISHLVYSATPRDIRAVLVDGRVVVQDGRLQQVDEVTLRQQLRQYFAHRWETLQDSLATS